MRTDAPSLSSDFCSRRVSALATPLVVGIVKPDSPATVLKEGRSLAPAPRPPTTGDDWFRLPKEVDAYLKDHFGLRQILIRAHKDITRPLLGFGNDLVLVGRDGRMFYLGEESVRQSAGLLVRDQRVADAADMLVRMNEELRARGIRFLVAPPPNGATIYQDDLPRWAQNAGKPTEYDLLLANLAAKGVPAVDLRPAVKNARARGSGLLYARYALDIPGRAGRIQRNCRGGLSSRIGGSNRPPRSGR